MTLTELFTNIANAIREKKGTTESIVAEDFPSEIESIESGGKVVLPDGTRFQESTFTTFDLAQFDTKQMTTMENMFRNCTLLTSIDLSKNDYQNLTLMVSMFNGCTSLASVNLSNLNLEVNIASMFSGCTSLTSVNLNNSKLDVTSISGLFASCTSLETIDLSNIDTDNATTVANMFKGCSSLVTVDISHFNLSSLGNTYTSMQNMVANCPNLSNNSMNSILKAFTTWDSTSLTSKRLSRLGLTQEQAEICTTLSNWADLEALGWTTGY